MQWPSGQLHDAGAGERDQRSNQQKHGKPRDADPNTGGRQEFDIAQSEALDFSESEIEPSQQPEDGPDGGALAGSLQPREWTAKDHGLRQSETGNRQIQPVRNDPVTNVDPGKDGTEEAEQSKGYDNDHAGCLIQQQNYPTGLADC